MGILSFLSFSPTASSVESFSVFIKTNIDFEERKEGAIIFAPWLAPGWYQYQRVSRNTGFAPTVPSTSIAGSTYLVIRCELEDMGLHYWHVYSIVKPNNSVLLRITDHCILVNLGEFKWTTLTYQVNIQIFCLIKK